MKKIIPIFFLLFSLAGCKKAIEKYKENAVITAMTNGQWQITKFEWNGSDITKDFNGYKFQYYKNYTVDAVRNGVLEKTGTWDGDPGNMSIKANFPGAAHPLILINGNWHIDNNSWTYVVASQTSGGETKKLRLEKL